MLTANTQWLYIAGMKKIIKENSVQLAIESIGSQALLASACEVSQQSVSKWLKKGIVPPRKVLLVEKVTGISRYKLNPLIYPKE